MEHIWGQRLFANNTWVCDPHAITQRRYIDEFIRLYYRGDRNRFFEEVESVHLDDLKTWFENTFKVPMIMNNIDSEDDKIYKLEELTEEERKALDQVCQTY